MTEDLDSLFWSTSRLGEAIRALARQSGLAPRIVAAPTQPQGLAQSDPDELGGWIEAAARQMGLEAEPAEAAYGEAERLVLGAGPALLRLPGPGRARFLALLRGGRRQVSILGPDLRVHRLGPERVRAELCREAEGPLRAEVDGLLDEAGVPVRRRSRARLAILRERLRDQRVGGCWLLRPSPGGSIWTQARQAQLPGRLVVFLGAHAVQYVLWIVSWLLVGRGALQGRLDPGWLLAWTLLLLTLIPLRMLVTWTEGRLAIGAGAVLKRWLLYGVLRLEPDEIRHQGVGQFLGRVIESEAVEALALSGGLLALLAAIELIIAAAVLAAGAGGGLHALLLLAWVAVTGLIGWAFYRRRGRWTGARLAITHDLVEKMVGHRTRLAQEGRESWHQGEDQALTSYLGLSSEMDRILVYLLTFEDGWLVLGFLGLTPAFVSGSATLVGLAISIGGVLLAYQALRKLGRGLWRLLSAAIAWEQVAPLFQAAARSERAGIPAGIPAGVPVPAGCPGPDDSEKTQPILDAHDLSFRYQDRAEPTLHGCSLRVHAGDRLFLEGPSGGGKSTLASLLVGLRRPDSGLLLLGGMDWGSLGSEGWRRRVVAAPQFHENHVLTETFAFNLLLGRRWPPRPEDLEAAELLCRELGLGELLDRMPAGLLQLVGESGWQLSHGEKSRLYIARALLQEAELVVLDESFAALDPESLRQALGCVLDQAPTLLVIGHP